MSQQPPSWSKPGDQPGYPQYSASSYPQQDAYPQQEAYPAGAPYPPQGNEPPPFNAGWAVATILFFWPLSFAAFGHLHRIYPLWMAGDQAGAYEASARVKRLGQIALGIVIGILALYIISIFILLGIATSVGSR